MRVRPPWYPPEPGLLDVVIDTGMAFGTGSHFTTRLCLRALQEVAAGVAARRRHRAPACWRWRRLRLGFAPVCAIDNDPIAGRPRARATPPPTASSSRVFRGGRHRPPGAALPEVEVCVANLLQGPILELARPAAATGPWRPRAPDPLGPARRAGRRGGGRARRLRARRQRAGERLAGAASGAA